MTAMTATDHGLVAAPTATAHVRPILRSKMFLYITEFFSGMAVMAAELGASRLLAPYFSSSQIVWTIIIGTIMIALALGSVWGGRKADRDPNPDKLYMRLMIAAVWIALIPLLGKYVIIVVSGLLVVTVSTNFLVIAAFISCMLIFVPPLFLLGTVTPGLVKFATDSLDDNASVVGRLSACNTIGSILGTFLPTFVTIPAVGTFVTFLIFFGLLLALAIAYFIASKVKLVASAISTVIFVVSAVASPMSGFAFWERGLTYEGESIYNYLQVKNLSDRTILSTNVLFGVQSVTMKRPGLTGMYYDTALAAPALADHADSALVLGMGTGTYARQLRQYYPHMHITGVEIDEKITALAGEYFKEPQDIPVSTYDGRAWLAASTSRYDVIMVDAYQDITIPFQMSSTEFFDMVKQHLNPGGVMVVNMNMISDGKGSINEALTGTIASVFGHRNILTADVPDTTNRELFAKTPSADEPGESGESEQSAQTKQHGDKAPQHATDSDIIQTGTPSSLQATAYMRTRDGDLEWAMGEVGSRLVPVKKPQSGAMILTDDRAPVELLGMHAIDQLIVQQAGPYREILETRGIQGLLELQ
ncbi:spermidine synthase [Bifidobacterium tibiigranuli]|jgi:spermidine synthase|uniref:spermidine synthase n=1 Tax=Bifidobacterium tibiigranuli TaxID=2172043 RepID=UPI0026EBEC9D|nr:fused MFS/spermidine synthase [Bifidobacterium tibiigranuli]MCI1649283.1 fused MFS/spermidine synthase [Bifidobacterium tibiigranuli]MCI2185854.1 fused MFS/spermidine synthase [Bifidobacterium tibiigranuli]MCI2203163.1 fused MFS/spermidine synthase [Bifidobacterium tibiigranuli]